MMNSLIQALNIIFRAGVASSAREVEFEIFEIGRTLVAAWQCRGVIPARQQRPCD